LAGLRGRLVFDAEAGTVRDGPRRYLLMRPDVLMGMFARLDPNARGAALQALAASAEQQGGDSLAGYFESLGRDGDALLQATAAAAADLGWGRWSFHRDGDVLRLVVTDSPFAHGFVPLVAVDVTAVADVACDDPARARDAAGDPGGPRVCAPICGLLAATARLVWGDQAAARADDAPGAIEAEELACAAAGHGCCEFVARRRALAR
jgi:hypothetical protein